MQGSVNATTHGSRPIARELDVLKIVLVMANVSRLVRISENVLVKIRGSDSIVVIHGARKIAAAMVAASTGFASVCRLGLVRTVHNPLVRGIVPVTECAII